MFLLNDTEIEDESEYNGTYLSKWVLVISPMLE